MDSHVQRNAAGLAEMMSTEFPAELVAFGVFFSNDSHLWDGGVGHDIAILDYKFISYLKYIIFIIVDGKEE
jgi:hypothetical protein